MSGAGVIAEHRAYYSHGDGVGRCTGCSWSGNDQIAFAAHQLDALATAGYELVRLPERMTPAFPGEFPRYLLGDSGEVVMADQAFKVVLMPGRSDLDPNEAREMAAALLAAANAAEAKS